MSFGSRDDSWAIIKRSISLIKIVSPVLAAALAPLPFSFRATLAGWAWMRVYFLIRWPRFRALVIRPVGGPAPPRAARMFFREPGPYSHETMPGRNQETEE